MGLDERAEVGDGVSEGCGCGIGGDLKGECCVLPGMMSSHDSVECCESLDERQNERCVFSVPVLLCIRYLGGISNAFSRVKK